jgi:hypothetical protein
MLIYTSSWFQKLPTEIFRIGISRRQPRYARKITEYKALAPGPWFSSTDDGTFRELYIKQLQHLDPKRVLEGLSTLSHNQDVALLCFEPSIASGPWCHRGLVSAWFNDELGLQVYEFGHEAEGFGWAHPKLPLEFRKRT